MKRQDLADAMTHRSIWSFALIAAIALCTGAIAVGGLGAGWNIVFTVASAAAAAGLGNTLRLDYSDHVVRRQARTAIRQQLDQIRRLQAEVVEIEARQAGLFEVGAGDGNSDLRRTADWLGSIAATLRREIEATATAIENWGDLAKDVQDAEVENYRSRSQRLINESQGSHDELGSD